MSLLRKLFGLADHVGSPTPQRSAPKASPRPLKSSACPSCGEVIDPPSQRKMKCPHCHEWVHPKTNPAGVRRLLTSEQAKVVQGEWRAKYERSDALGKVQSLGFSEGDFEREARRLGPGYKPADVFWALANKATIEAARRGDWHCAQMAYYMMAWHLHDEEQPFVDVLRESARAQLRYIAASGPEYQAEIMGGECRLCRKLKGRRSTVKDALKRLPIPVEQCENGFCRCSWAAWRKGWK